MLRVTTFLLLISLVTCRPPQWLLDAQNKGRQAVGDVGEHGQQAWGQVQGGAERLKEELEQGGKDLHGKVHGLLDGSNEESNEEESNEEKDEVEKRDWDAFKAWVQDKWGKAKTAGSKAIAKVKEAGSTAGQKIKGVFTHNNKDGATTGVRANREVTHIASKRDWAEDKVEKRDWDAFKAWVQDKWGKAKTAGSKAIAKVKEAGSTAGQKKNKDGATTGVRANREVTHIASKRDWAVTDDEAKRDWADIQAWLKSKWQKTKQTASDAGSKVKGWASTAGSKIKGAFTGDDKKEGREV